MAPTTPNAKERLDRAQRELAALRAGIERSTSLTAIVGAIVLIALAGWFYYGTKLFAEVTDPEKLVNYAKVTLDSNLPETRKALEEHIIKNSPAWAEELSKQLVKSVPDLRVKLEAAALKQMDESLEKAHLLAEKEFRDFLRKNKKQIDQMYKEIAADPKNAEKHLKGLQLALEDDFQGDLKNDVAQLLKLVKDCKIGLQSMVDPKGLSKDERLEREAWTLARAIWKEHLEEPIPRAVFPKTGGKTPGAEKSPKSGN